MKKLILIGGGGHCKSCIDIIEVENKFSIFGILDIESKVGSRVLNYKIIDIVENFHKYLDINTYFFITIGYSASNPEIRKILYQQIKSAGGKFAIITSPNAFVSKHASIFDGTIIMHHTVVNTHAQVGFNCIICSNAILEHDTIINDHSIIMDGAVVEGGAIVEEIGYLESNYVLKRGRIHR